MKKTKIIIPALGMLLLGAAASVTGTVAWFSMNDTVTASGMNIQAKTNDAYLVISETSDGTFDKDANAMVLSPTSGTALKLVTPLNVASNVDYYATLANKTAETPVTTTPSKFTNAASVLWGTTTSSDPSQVQASNITDLVGGTGFDNGALTAYVQSSELWFKVKTADALGSNLTCDQVTFTNSGSNTIAESGRALIVSEEGKYQLFSFASGAVTAHTGDAALYTEINTTPKKLTCFFYFDGTDAAAYTDNATTLSALTAAFQFSIA